MKPLFHEYFNLVAGIILLLDQGVDLIYLNENWKGLRKSSLDKAFITIMLIPILMNALAIYYHRSNSIRKFRKKLMPRFLSQFWKRSWNFPLIPFKKTHNFKKTSHSKAISLSKTVFYIFSFPLSILIYCLTLVLNIPYILLSTFWTALWVPYLTIGGFAIWLRLPYILPLAKVNRFVKRHINKSVEDELAVVKLLTWITMLQVVANQVPLLYIKITYSLFDSSWTPVGLGSVLITVFNTIYHSARLAYYLFRSSQEGDLIAMSE